MSELINIKIDGKPLSVAKGTNVLEAARQAGVEISHFCYHPGLSSPAVCRQCLVEVKGAPKLVPSCYTPVAPDMEVTTNNERTLLARQQMLEFTLVNHPVDCPICDKAGECLLQRHYQAWDSESSRVDYDKVHKPKMVDLGPTIVLDAERCILCTRCIRVCDEVAKEHQLEMAWRGDREQLTVAPGKVLDNPYSLNTVDVCPVGALTSKDFRFTMRAWQLHATPSVCAGCATGCNMEIHHAQGRIYRLVPRPNAEVNQHWMCDEGRFTYKEVGHERLGGATLSGQPTSLEKAIAFVAERLAGLKQAAGDLKLAGVVLNAQATNEDNFALFHVATELGIERVYLAGRAARPERADDILRHADVNPNSAGAKAIAGARGKGTTQLMSDLAAGSLKALWILGDAVDLDDDALEAIGRLDLAVYQTPHKSALAGRANVVLPAASWAEVDGTVTTAKGLVQRLRRAVEPPGAARPHHELVGLIARKLGLTWDYPSVRALFQHMKISVPAFADADFGREVRTVQLRFAHSRG
jgi:NADH-quinone oxidoreductase subunit G